MLSIFRREMAAFFHTAVGYVFMGVFLALSTVMFCLSILQQRSSDLLTFLGQLSYLWMLLSPVLTMRLLAEERRMGTDTLLLSSPVSLTGIVLGKYLAAVCVMLLTVALTLVYVAVIAAYGAVYAGEAAVGYAGFILQGCAFIALDLFLSGLCKSPVTAAVLSFGANLAVWMMDLLASAAPQWLERALSFLSLYSRNEPFLMGQLSYASVLYDLSFAAAFLALTVFVMDRRRYGR